jgi:acetolactate synthase-1/3 small subunit
MRRLLNEDNYQVKSMRHTISVLLQNKPGVLSRVTGLFSGRGYNIESLCVNKTLDPNVSCLTLVTFGQDQIVEQITKQLHKLIDVIKVTDMAETEYVEREMALIRIKAESGTRAEVLRVIDIFRGKVVDVSQKSYAVEITGTEEKIQAVIDILKPIGIQEIVKTGAIAMSRAKKNQ